MHSTSLIYNFQGSGSRMGLSLILNAAINEYYCSSTSGFGFKVVLHSPHELPQIDEFGLGIANGYESRIVATPTISGASDAVRKTPMKIRQCVYQSENFLTYYRLVETKYDSVHSIPYNSKQFSFQRLLA